MILDSVPYIPKYQIRAITAASLFDGHDAAINIIRRILQVSGVEVIHLGHNRSATEIVEAAIQEDVHCIAVSCYQGGHMEFFKYIIDLLAKANCHHIKVFGGGGGVIVPKEIDELEKYGVTKIYSPNHGQKLGLQGIVNDLIKLVDYPLWGNLGLSIIGDLDVSLPSIVSRTITCVERAALKNNSELAIWRKALNERIALEKKIQAPVLGITGTGGAGKSTLTDEFLLRFLYDFSDKQVAILSIDPTRRRSGGALLGDRIRMNSLKSNKIYLRSLATRGSGMEINQGLGDIILILQAAGYNLIIVETAGIGQGDAAIVDLVNISLYVMTSDFGAASQLEKIDMLDFADLIAINKFDRQGSEDAIRDVRKQVQRNRNDWQRPLEQMSVYGTIASKFNDNGVTALYLAIIDAIKDKTGTTITSLRSKPKYQCSLDKNIIIPVERIRYLADIADTIYAYHAETHSQSKLVRQVWQMEEVFKGLVKKNQDKNELSPLLDRIQLEIDELKTNYTKETNQLLTEWPQIQKAYSGNEYIYKVRNREFRVPLSIRSLSGIDIPKVVLPSYSDLGDIYEWMRLENMPGLFPYTAGVFPFKRTDEDPTRMFAGEGDPDRTNRRFKMLSNNAKAARLSTAFDSVTLYGQNPDKQPDIYGKIGNSGVSICTLDDMKILYSGFNLCSPNTSVSMTINGPAPIILAFFLNTAFEQQKDFFKKKEQREPTSDELTQIKKMVFRNIRGTVQADILKEDQGQNTCIFSIDFSLRMMADMQQYFIKNEIKNFYSVSISGYHIAEAGANPITQLAFTLANGFTYVEYYLSRGMHIDDFAPNLSFFFSNGMDPEFTVIGRVARRIWAIVMRERYGAANRSQMLKYHIQTSGRSLHSQEIQFNDVRTTLQALCAIYDNCNSLHTNAYDEAITTPSEESVRRALAIQLIINREWGLTKNENSLQGSFVVETLTKLVEDAVLDEFYRINTRGGVLGAMETGYQRNKIQEESIYYENIKHSGKLPIIGVNCFLSAQIIGEPQECKVELARATNEEKENQLINLRDFHARHVDLAPLALKRLQQVVLNGENVFAELIETVKSCSLGQITEVLYKVGGQYRRNM